MRVGDKATDLTETFPGTWTIIKVWDDGDVSLVDESGLRIDVASECFEHEWKLENEE